MENTTNRDLTVHEFAQVNGLPYAQAGALVKVLRDNNLLEQVGTQRQEGARGKGRAVYRFTPEAFENLVSLLTNTFTGEVEVDGTPVDSTDNF